MIDLLNLEIKKTVDEGRAIAKLDPVQIEIFEARYDQIIEKGLAENPPSISRGQFLRNEAERNRAKSEKPAGSLEGVPSGDAGLYVRF